MSELEEATLNNRSLRSRKHNRLDEDLDDVENLKKSEPIRKKKVNQKAKASKRREKSQTSDQIFEEDSESEIIPNPQEKVKGS